MMAEEKKIVLDGFITLEGRFLEKLWAAYLFNKGEKVCERYETGGFHHDVLTQGYDSTLYECTGQKEITTAKIDKLVNDASQIKDAIQKEGEQPLKSVKLVVSLNRNSWGEGARKTFDLAQNSLKRIGLSLERIEDYDVLYPLLYEGILGFAFIQNRLYPIGPEEYGIRYDKGKQGHPFVKRFSPIKIEEFKQLPQSFLPSLYWGEFYRQLQERWAEEELESKLSFFWEKYSYGGFGIKWRSSQDMRELYKRTSYIHSYLAEDHEDNALLQHSWSKKHDFYNVYVFDNRDELDRKEISELLGMLATAAEAYRQKGYGEAELYFGHIITSTEDWSPRAWWEARETAREDLKIHKSEILRGGDVLIKLLNEGILGFAFSELDYAANQIKLVGPGIPAIRIKEGKLSIAEIEEGRL
jgi:hypothetical protein